MGRNLSAFLSILICSAVGSILAGLEYYLHTHNVPFMRVILSQGVGIVGLMGITIIIFVIIGLVISAFKV